MNRFEIRPNRLSLRRLTLRFVLMLLPCAAGAAELAFLDDYRWQSRILMVAPASDAVLDTTATLVQAGEALAERDVIWVLVTEASVRSNDGGFLARGRGMLLARHFGLDTDGADGADGADAGDALVVLIGKDGGIKHRATAFDLDDVFDRIDSMPMRRREADAEAAGGSARP